MPLALPSLRLGSRGPEVQNWQRFLNDAMDAGLSVDGAFGPRTSHATRTWQLAHALTPDGIVGPKTRTAALSHASHSTGHASLGFIQFLQAKNYTPTAETGGRVIDLVVVHDMEYFETPDGAEWCAMFFAGVNAPRASAHFSVDVNSIVQSVREDDVAWHAKGANHNGIGVEHAGYARQSRAEWLDEYSRAELALSAKLVARLCRTYGIPVKWLDADALRAGGGRGITGHWQVTQAFGGTHYDPGPNFPVDEYLAMVSSALTALDAGSV